MCSAGYSGTAPTCTACVVGTYKSGAANANCDSCSGGKTTDGTGKTAASQCGINHFTEYIWFLFDQRGNQLKFC